ncbi:hypothetical protein LCGC14_0695410 [marine sediment metagenome]|uniref:Uncharacterized protein n=1 Tax=marine sediment metagenome TaxID=412755 RepID=A0A0F9QP24_9ZZZZ
MTDNALANIPIITQAILQVQPLNFHTRKLDELEVLHLLADKMKAAIEIKNDIGEAQVRIYRDAGHRLSTTFRRGGDGSNQYGKRAKHEKLRLADWGYTPRIADICRKIAALPDDMFEDLILGVRTREHLTHQEITIPFFHKAGRIHIMRQRGISTDRPYTPAQSVATDLELAWHMFRAGEDYGYLNEDYAPDRDGVFYCRW